MSEQEMVDFTTIVDFFSAVLELLLKFVAIFLTDFTVLSKKLAC